MKYLVICPKCGRSHDYNIYGFKIGGTVYVKCPHHVGKQVFKISEQDVVIRKVL